MTSTKEDKLIRVDVLSARIRSPPLLLLSPPPLPEKSEGEAVDRKKVVRVREFVETLHSSLFFRRAYGRIEAIKVDRRNNVNRRPATIAAAWRTAFGGVCQTIQKCIVDGPCDGGKREKGGLVALVYGPEPTVSDVLDREHRDSRTSNGGAKATSRFVIAQFGQPRLWGEA